MNINTSIIDQGLAGVQDEIRQQAETDLGIKDIWCLKSLASLVPTLCVGMQFGRVAPYS